MTTELTDRAAILDVVVGYATAVDTRDWAALAALFTDDAHWKYPAAGEDLAGPAAIVARISRSIGGLDATQHLIGNHVITVHGDEAEHTCYFHAQHVRHGLAAGENYVAAGRYEDRLRRTPEGWRLSHRVIDSVWHEGNPAVIPRSR